ncbi:MAG TPA: M67 family metallopeptidase [Pyrinomonadaceae bacterium]|nr:M67 family metallopeptidase [Pyrinomonadaceae bacterium]
MSAESYTGGRAEGERSLVTLLRAQVEEILAHARASRPEECCGLVGERDGLGASVYRLRNIAPDPRVAYDGDPQDLCEAQRVMRARGEALLGIYHSHPREAAPVPSESDVRLAYHPSAIYFIVGLEENGTKEEGEDFAASLHAFRIFRSEKRWERVEYAVVES